MLRSLVGSEMCIRDRYRGLWKKAGIVTGLTKSWLVSSRKPHEFDPFMRVHDDDLALILRLQQMSPQEQEEYMKMLDKKERDERDAKEDEATKAFLANQSTWSEQPAAQTSETYEVVYPAGIAFRATTSWDDKLPPSVPIAPCGEQFESTTTVSGDDGVEYVQGVNGFWLPMTTMDKNTVVIQKAGAGMAQGAPARAPVPAQAESLPPGWSKHYDPGTGAPYYVNPATGESTWELPTASDTANMHEDHTDNAPEIRQEHAKEEADVRFLMDMGFGSQDQCRRVLHQNGMDTQRAIDAFLSGGGQA
eukprot:TRINITY_DN19663_c0_g1_i1.p1 TRINITY_DN19663_c0_g1~~TRINITY_DN19663_c0_g1_i1.p1  ORF type:complete len:305 (+),score=89.57 TRINITY_DN19663_c0_g1_i1:149-1063(+)